MSASETTAPLVTRRHAALGLAALTLAAPIAAAHGDTEARRLFRALARAERRLTAASVARDALQVRLLAAAGLTLATASHAALTARDGAYDDLCRREEAAGAEVDRLTAALLAAPAACAADLACKLRLGLYLSGELDLLPVLDGPLRSVVVRAGGWAAVADAVRRIEAAAT